MNSYESSAGDAAEGGRSGWDGTPLAHDWSFWRTSENAVSAPSSDQPPPSLDGGAIVPVSWWLIFADELTEE